MTVADTVPADAPAYDLRPQPGRSLYVRAVERTSFRTDRPRVLMTVSTMDLEAGRGDVYVAIGLGRHLEHLGYEVLYAPPERWYELAAEADLVVSMVAEPKLVLDPTRLAPGSGRLIAWIRNNTFRWVGSGGLKLYDGVLCSSERTLEEVRRVFGGPAGTLRIGVDAALFAAGDGSERAGAVTTVNLWGRPRQTFDALAEIPPDFPLAIYGIQRGLTAELQPLAHGPVSYFVLPSLYRQAAVVLDDQQIANQAYGNVNSRIYEALAAGALPITNSRNGLDDVGLADIPVYSSSEELRSLVVEALEQPEGREELVAGLRRVVLARHTYEQRAAAFHEYVQKHRLLEARTESPTATIVGFHPDYRATNPFQDMLYSAAGDIVPVAVKQPAEVADAPRFGPNPGVFHLHWTATILGPAQTEAQARWLRGRFVESLDALKARGGRVLWTIHNILPHECRYPEIECELAQQIADRADAIHVMCEATIGAAAPFYRLPRDRTHVIPHPSYVGVYPNDIDQAAARARLKLADDVPVLLCLGQVRPYKGLERLIDAFAEASSKEPDLRLIVAGKPGRFTGVKPLMERCTAQPGVTTVFEEIPDDDLQLYFNACDVVVLPHAQVLNSGLAMLALSFGRPVVAPRTGCLEALVTPDIGTQFDPDGRDLAMALALSPRLRDERYRQAARAKATELSVERVSSRFGQLLAGLAG